jgi:RNase P/RNase MRP subunit POP5
VSNSERDLRKQFYSLKLEMQVLETNKFEKRAFLYFDIISWLESKIESKTIQEVIKEKAKIKIAEN